MSHFFVNNLIGNDTYSGTTELAPFLTIGKARTSFGIGDTIWIKNTGTDYTGVDANSSMFYSSAHGSSGLGLLKIYGYTNTLGDNGIVSLNVAGNNYGFWLDSGCWYDIRNIRVYSSNKDGFKISAKNVKIENCISENSFFESGFLCTSSGYLIIKCKAFNNKKTGFTVYGSIPNNASGGYPSSIISCETYKNLSYGIEPRYITNIINCLIYNNSNGIRWQNGAVNGLIIGNTVVNNYSDNIHLSTFDERNSAVVLNNIITGAGRLYSNGYGMYLYSGVKPNEGLNYMNYNLYYDNTSGNIDYGTMGINSLIGNPSFTSGTSYALTSSSAAIGKGLDMGTGLDIGAIQLSSSGGDDSRSVRGNYIGR